jgi:hypothetical protein
MAGEFPVGLREDLQAEVVRVMRLLQESDWTVDVISWESRWLKSSERRINFAATHKTGKRIRLTCPVSRLSERLLALLAKIET